MPKVSEARREAMRGRLLDAAASVLLREGYADTTMRQIIAEAGVAPNTVYAHFDSKDAILEALLGRFSAHAMQAFAQHAARDDDELLLEWMLERLDRPPLHADTLLAGLRTRMTDDTPDRLVQRTNRLIIEMLSPAVERLRDAQLLKIDDIDAFLELIDITFDGMTRRAETDSFVTSWERVANVRRQLLSKQIVSP